MKSKFAFAVVVTLLAFIGSALGTVQQVVNSIVATTCTNQLVRSIAATGAATCATVANADMANSAITISGASTALGGTYAPVRASATPANPTGTTSLTQVMAGIAGSFTPTTSGAVNFNTSVQTFQATAAQGCQVQMRFGTGSAPANGAAATGTALGQNINNTLMLANQSVSSGLTARVTGLTPSTTYWFDLGFAAVTGGTCSLFNISYTIQET